MNMRAWAANNLAARLLAGPWALPAIKDAIRAQLRPVHPSTRAALAVRIFAFGDTPSPPAPHVLAAYLLDSPYFRPPPGHRPPTVLDPPCFAPAPAFAALPIPALATPGELGAWLGLSADELDWFADARRGHARAETAPLQHYTYAFARKRGGGQRLVEAPKPRLKAMQRRILHEILAHVPVHDAAHGFVAGRSCLTGAQGHASEAVVASFDLAQFFPSIARPRIHGVFRSLGYPPAVARGLAGLCTTVTPAPIVQRLAAPHRPDLGLLALYGVPHLPQGAPTSPSLANLLAWRLDMRLRRLAGTAGAYYTRYADDLTFSGDASFARGFLRFQTTVARIAREEGFHLNAAKTRIMPNHTRQRVTGIVVNTHCNVSRAAFDALKAVLYHCVRTGPAGQNRASVPDFRRDLDGRVAWVEHINPQRGAKLRLLFERIDWGAANAGDV